MKNASMSNLCNVLLHDAILQTYPEERECLPEYIKGLKKYKQSINNFFLIMIEKISV